MLKLNKINQCYHESHTLWDLNLELNQGDCTCLMGRNGVGKTTLLKCIMGLLPLQSGEIFFEDKPIHKIGAEKRALIGIAYVPQGRDIFSQLSVEENLRVGLTVKKNGDEIPESIFDLFPVLKKMLQRRGGDLSGGQQQQLAIARALILEPKLLILDEPCEGIQPNIVAEIGEIIIQLNKVLKMTILLVEQKLPFAKRVAERFMIMDKGRRVADGAISCLDDALIKKYLTV